MGLWNPLDWIASVPLLSIAMAVGGGALLFTNGIRALNWLHTRFGFLRPLKSDERYSRFVWFGLLGLAFAWVLVIGFYVPGRSTSGFMQRPREVWLLDQTLCVTDAKNLSAGKMGRVTVYLRITCLDRASGHRLVRRNLGSVKQLRAGPGGLYVLNVPIFPRSLWVGSELYFLEPRAGTLTLLADEEELGRRAGLSGEIYSIETDDSELRLIALDKRRGSVPLLALLQAAGVTPGARPAPLAPVAVRDGRIEIGNLRITQESTTMRADGPYRLTLAGPARKLDYTEDTLVLRDLLGAARSDDLLRYLHVDDAEILLFSDTHAAALDSRTGAVRWNVRL